MTPFLQCHVLTMESGAVYLARVMAPDRRAGVASASALALSAERGAIWDSAAFPCDDSQRAAGPGLELIRAASGSALPRPPFTSDPAELIRRAMAQGVPVYWIEPGAVTDPEAHGNSAPLGAPEFQFSDGPAGSRSTSADFLTLAEGLANLGPALYVPAADLATWRPPLMDLTPETAEGLETAPEAPPPPAPRNGPSPETLGPS